MDGQDEDDGKVIEKVSAMAKEFKQTKNTGAVKKLTKDMSPSQTSFRKSVGAKEAENYYTYQVENNDNIRAKMKKRRQQLSHDSSQENMNIQSSNVDTCFQLKLGPS